MKLDPKNIAKGKWWDEGITLVSGCTRVSEACTNCWSLAMEKRCGREGPVTFHPERLARFAKGKPRTIAIWNDCFHEKVLNYQIVDIANATADTPRNTYIILTKRSKRLPFLCWPKNVIVGVTSENQRWLDERVPDLLQAGVDCRMISAEPLLSELRFPSMGGIGWVVVGCESGPRRRECKIEWVRSIVQQCKDAGVACFVKQLQIDGKVVHDMSLFPEDLRVRELPND
jgi:protein gp37